MGKLRASIICLMAALGALCWAISAFRGGHPAEREPLHNPHANASPSVVPMGAASTHASSQANRRPATADSARTRLNAGSVGEWQVNTGSFGYVTKLSGASYLSGVTSPEAAAESFLRSFARELLGVGFDSLVPTDRRLSGSGAQVLYEQRENGLAVMGSRVNLLLDEGGNLLYLASAVHKGPSPSPVPKINQAEAAFAVRAALAGYLSKAGGSIEVPEYSLDHLTRAATLMYWLSGNSIALIYKVEFTLASPHYGSMQALVDAQTNTVVALKPQSKN